METLKTVLEKTLKEAGTEEVVAKGRAITLWSEVAGKEIDKATEASHIEKGIMFIKTESPVWRNELMFQKREIIDRINNHLKKATVKDIKFI